MWFVSSGTTAVGNMKFIIAVGFLIWHLVKPMKLVQTLREVRTWVILVLLQSKRLIVNSPLSSNRKIWPSPILAGSLVVIFALVCSTKRTYCQQSIGYAMLNKQSFYLEFAGNGHSALCLNYERIFHAPKTDFLHYTVRVGVGFTSRSIDSSAITNFPVEATVLVGTKKHFLEAGLGYTVSLGKEYEDTSVNPPLHYKSLSGFYCFRLGYRFAMQDGILLRFAPSLQLEQVPTWKLDLSWGVSIGISFSVFRNIWD